MFHVELSLSSRLMQSPGETDVPRGTSVSVLKTLLRKTMQKPVQTAETQSFPNDFMLKTENGYYYGTVKNGVWWRHYLKGGWFSRGSSVIWMNAQGFFFRRYLTKKIMHIPTFKIRDFALGKGHAGKYTGLPTLKITWAEKNLILCSGFIISKSGEETAKWAMVLERLLSKQHPITGRR
jgi:hypothetical protein